VGKKAEDCYRTPCQATAGSWEGEEERSIGLNFKRAVEVPKRTSPALGRKTRRGAKIHTVCIWLEKEGKKKNELETFSELTSGKEGTKLK